jgi:hypothetical protein
MSFKTFCSEFCKFHDNVFVHARPIDLLQIFGGYVIVIRDNYLVDVSSRIEVRDNHFVNDLTPAEVEARFFKGVRFGLTEQFPAWLRDPNK